MKTWSVFAGPTRAVRRRNFLRPFGAYGRVNRLARISHHLTVEARNKPAITALRLLAGLNAGFKYARIIQEMRRRAARALY